MVPPITGDEIAGVARSVFSAQDDTGKARAEHVFRRRYIEVDLTDGGTAATAAVEKTIHTAQVSGRVISAQVSTPVTAAQDAANTAQFKLFKRPSGGGSTQIGIFDTTTGQGGTITAWTPVTLSLTAANVLYNATDQLTAQLTKAGTGVAVANATGQAHMTVLIEEGT